MVTEFVSWHYWVMQGLELCVLIHKLQVSHEFNSAEFWNNRETPKQYLLGISLLISICSYWFREKSGINMENSNFVHVKIFVSWWPHISVGFSPPSPSNNSYLSRMECVRPRVCVSAGLCHVGGPSGWPRVVAAGAGLCYNAFSLW